MSNLLKRLSLRSFTWCCTTHAGGDVSRLNSSESRILTASYTYIMFPLLNLHRYRVPVHVSTTKTKGSTITHYRVGWDVRADFTSASSSSSSSSASEISMSTAGSYDIRAIRNNGSSLRCQSDNCTFALGAEVQTLDVYSGDTNELAGGEYRLSYTTGLVEENTNVTSVSDCIPFNATYDDFGTAVESVTGSAVLVTRERITDPGYGYRYWVTFFGAGVIGDVPSLKVTDFSGDSTANCSAWSVVTGSSGGVDVTAATTQQHLSVATQIDGGFLSPGTAYFTRISAINSVGVGEAQESESQDDCGGVEGACAPRAPPPPPVDAKVCCCCCVWLLFLLLYRNIVWLPLVCIPFCHNVGPSRQLLPQVFECACQNLVRSQSIAGVVAA